jgi:hypothetical protein
MAAWSRVEPDAYGRLDLRSHALLADVPLHDVWRVDLPGGGAGRTLADVRSLMNVEDLREQPVVRVLFALRRFLGRLFAWDAPPRTGRTYLDRLDDEDRRRSLVAPGSAEGPFRVLYVRPFEAVSEVRNATVHAFSVLALQPRSEGYRLFWAIHVAPVGRITGLYMALIDPFRRLLVYPAILRHLHRSWRTRHPAAPASGR